MPPKTEKSTVRPISKSAASKSKSPTKSKTSSSSSSFEGFSDKTIQYFTKLKTNNVREWFQVIITSVYHKPTNLFDIVALFMPLLCKVTTTSAQHTQTNLFDIVAQLLPLLYQANKDFYTNHVSEPMAKLAVALQGDFGELKIYRPYRDVRFSTDKTPIKEHIAMSGPGAGKSGCGGHYFHLKEKEYMLATGIYLPDAKQLTKFRELVTNPTEAKKIHALLDELEPHGWTLNDDGKLTSAPKGYKKDDPEIDLLRYKSLAVTCKRPIDDQLIDGAACLKMVKDGWTLASKWSKWLEENVA